MKSDAPPEFNLAAAVLATEEEDVQLQRREVQWLHDRFRRQPDKITGKWLDMEWRELQDMEAHLEDMRRVYGAR